ncbi:MAG: Fmu (Sun) domain-containing protein [Bacteroidota bacterium]
MKYYSYLNSAGEIIELYKAQQPFHLFIKDFFRQYKKYGSSDRRQITHICYCYFRLGNSLKDTPVTEKLIIALFLCSFQKNEILAHVKPAWNEQVNLSVKEKCVLLNIQFDVSNIFPCGDQISNAIDKTDFILSHLVQPDVFLRIRPGYKKTIINKLEHEKIIFSVTNENCIGLPNTTKVDTLLEINKEAVVQDYSSQRTGSFLQLAKDDGAPVKIWDCCAGSGGKSIMAKDLLGHVVLTVSDIRESALINLKKRFAEAGIRSYKTLMIDLTAGIINLAPASFELIIADVPCTGSGTWGRTPEWLSFFNENEIDKYHQLQKKIVATAMPCLKTGGFFLYITCSVFKRENEDMVDFIKTNLSADLIKMEVLKGYGMKADTMFAALLKKKL